MDRIHAKKLVIVAAWLAFAPHSASADENCDCEQYVHLTRFTSLADQVSQIGSAALNENGQSLSRERVAAMKLRIESDSMIPQHCKKELTKKFDALSIKVVLRGMMGDSIRNAQLGEGGGLAADYDSTYLSKFRYKPDSCWKPVQSNGRTQLFADPSRPACVSDSAKAADDFYAKPTSELTQALGEGYEESKARMLQSFHQIVTAGSEKEAMARIAANRKNLSSDEFLNVVAAVGNKLSGNYDDARADDNKTTSSVSGDTLLHAIRSNSALLGTNISQQGAVGLTAPPGKELAGVCRDIAVFQAKMLEAGGFKNTYVVSYVLAGNGHSTVITQKPGTKELAQLNYDGIARVKNQDGSVAMDRRGNMPDVTLDFLVSRPDGRVVADVPSEMGKFLAEAAGFKITRLDPMARTSSSMVAADLSGGRRARASARAFAGQDATGERYVGIASDVSYAQNTIAPSKIGVVGALTEKPRQIDTGYIENETAPVAYAQVEQHLKTKPIRLSDSAALTLDSDLTATGAIAKVSSKYAYDNGLAITGTTRMNGEARIDQHSRGGKYDAQYRAGIQINPAASRDIRRGGIVMPIPNLNHAYAEVSQRYRIAPDLTLLTDVIVDKSLLGTRGKAQIGIASRTFAANAQVAGRLTKSSSLLEDNSFWRAGVDMTWRPSPHVYHNVSSQIPLEGGDLAHRTQFMLSSGLLF
jgi:hypothetical protein